METVFQDNRLHKLKAGTLSISFICFFPKGFLGRDGISSPHSLLCKCYKITVAVPLNIIELLVGGKYFYSGPPLFLNLYSTRESIAFSDYAIANL